jgi:cell division protein FtsB
MLKDSFIELKRFLKSKKNTLLTILIVTLLLLVLCLPDYAKLQRLKRENIKTKEKISRIKKDIDKLKSNIRRLEQDSAFWEDIARKELGVVKKGTTAVDIND